MRLTSGLLPTILSTNALKYRQNSPPTVFSSRHNHPLSTYLDSNWHQHRPIRPTFLVSIYLSDQAFSLAATYSSSRSHQHPASRPTFLVSIHLSDQAFSQAATYSSSRSHQHPPSRPTFLVSIHLSDQAFSQAATYSSSRSHQHPPSRPPISPISAQQTHQSRHQTLFFSIFFVGELVCLPAIWSTS